MEELKVDAGTVKVSVDTLIERMVKDIREGDMDAIKHIAEHMYPVAVEDVEGCEGEEVHVSVDFQQALDSKLKDIF